MALVFNEKHGSNVKLSNDRTTATRVDARDNSNGILFTSRGFRVGESLELRLDALSSSTQGGGLEIGITDTPPPRGPLPGTATDMKDGTTVMVSGSNVAQNGIEIDIINHNLHHIQPGEKLGLRLDGAFMEFLLRGECVTKINVAKWKDVYGVIDLFGKASKVTITSLGMSVRTSSEVDYSKKEIKGMITRMAKKDIGDVEKVSDQVKAVDAAYRRHGSCKAAKQQAAAYMATLQGGMIIPLYLKQLIKWGLKTHVTLYNDVRSICWNYCDHSHELCRQLGEAGLLDTCTEELRVLQKDYRSSEGSLMTVYTALGIIHNCAKVRENVRRLHQCRFIEAAAPYTRTDANPRDVVLTAVMAISYIIEENNAAVARIDAATMLAVLDKLRRAIDQAETHQHDGWHAYELCTGLANLATDTRNLKTAVDRGAHGLFGCLLLKALDDQDRLAALEAIDAHISPETCKAIAGKEGMLQLLVNTKDKKKGAVKEKAIQVHQKLTKMVEEQARSQPPAPTAGAGEGAVALMQQLASLSPRDSTSPRGSTGDLSSILEGILGVNLGKEQRHSRVPAPGPCAYKALCAAFFKTLNLHESFFNREFDMCYCRQCLTERKDKDYYQRGVPPKLYGLPIGWYRFGLHLPPRARALDVDKKWHRAFHGTRHEKIPKILEVGELAAAGRDILGGERVRELSGHFCEGYKPDGFNTKQIFLSPSILYSGVDAYASPARWSHNNKTYVTRVAFQVFISPSAYQVGPQTIGAKTQIDPKFPNSEIEWFTSQQGSTMLAGLLVKIVEK